MDPGMLDAATSGNVTKMMRLNQDIPGVLLRRTPQGNTCLHIASIHGHQGFCTEAQALETSLLAAVNSEGERRLCSPPWKAAVFR